MNLKFGFQHSLRLASLALMLMSCIAGQVGEKPTASSSGGSTNPSAPNPISTTVLSGTVSTYGGFTIQITGSNLSAASLASLSVGNIPCTNITDVTTNSVINCDVSLRSLATVETAGLKTITAIDINGLSGSLSNAILLSHRAPRLNNILNGGTSVSSGLQAGGYNLTLKGQYFRLGANSNLCSTLTVDNSTDITCTVANFTGTGITTLDVDVSNDDGLTDPDTNNFNLLSPFPAPSINTVTNLTTGSSLVRAKGGETIRIVGSFANHASTSIQLSVGSDSTSGILPLTPSATQLDFIAPRLGSSGRVTVTVVNPDLQSADNTTDIRYIPVVESVVTDPTNDSSGTTAGSEQVLISGYGFSNTDQAVFDPGGAPANCTGFTALSATSVRCTTPAHADTADATVDVVVNINTVGPDGTADGTSDSSSTGFEFRGDPTIANIVEDASGDNTISVLGGETIIIMGTNFYDASVDINGANCPITNATTDTQIRCTVPASSSMGAANITVTNKKTGRSASNSTSIDYVPKITSVVTKATNLPKGSVNGGFTIQIYGTGFTGANSVIVDPGGENDACGPVTVSSDSLIECDTLPHAVGFASIKVIETGSNASTDSSTDTFVRFEFDAGPIITTVINATYPSVAYGPFNTTTPITINGSNFDPTVDVTLEGESCLNPVVTGGNTINCTAQGTLGNPVGLYDVTVTNVADQIQETSTDAWEYVGAPVYNSVVSNNSGAVANIAAGPIAGGHYITINGSGFKDSTVDVGGNDCPIFNSSSDANTLVCTAPDNSSDGGAETVDITIRNGDGQSVTASNAWTFRVAPAFVSVLPTFTGAGSSRQITITGTGFTQTIQAPTVLIDTASCPISASTSTSLTCTAPAQTAGVKNITITNEDGQSITQNSAFTYLPSPTITNVYQTTGGAGDTNLPQGGSNITITGSNFLSGATVNLEGNPCTSVNVSSDTNLTCNVPALTPGDYTVSLRNGDDQTVDSTSDFLTVLGVPTITNTERNNLLGVPAGGTGGGEAIRITGSNFYGSPTITINGSACGITSTTDSLIICTAPANATPDAYPINLVDGEGQTALVGDMSNDATWWYMDTPIVTSLSASYGPATGGTTINIIGSNFRRIDFNATDDINPTIVLDPGGTDTTCDIVSYNNSGSLTCTTGNRGSTGAVNVQVTNPHGVPSTGGPTFNYVNNPSPTGVNPPFGLSTGGGTPITITGNDFDASSGTTVTIGGTSCASHTTDNANQITCLLGSHGSHDLSVDIQVTNTGSGLSGTLADSFSYLQTPSITNVENTTLSYSNINYGPTTSTPITITGVNFDPFGNMTVTFDRAGNATPCGSVIVDSATQLRCTLANHTGGHETVDVDVSNDVNLVGTSSNAYSFAPPPNINSVLAPASGVIPLSQSVSVTIDGTNFDDTNDIHELTVAGTTCAGTITNTTTQATCSAIPPQTITGGKSITIRNKDGQYSNTLPSALNAKARPTISGIVPPSGIPSTATPITINGSGFDTGTTVTINGALCTGFTFNNSSSISCNTPNLVAGNYTVRVIDDVTQDATYDYFTYQSQTILNWQEGAGSPTPPNPDSFGTTSVNVTHTYTLRNEGDLTSGQITVVTEGATGAFFKGTDNCTGTTLTPSATCTVQLIFLGSLNPASTTFNLGLKATETGGDSDTHNATGSTP